MCAVCQCFNERRVMSFLPLEQKTFVLQFVWLCVKFFTASSNYRATHRTLITMNHSFATFTQEEAETTQVINHKKAKLLLEGDATALEFTLK